MQDFERLVGPYPTYLWLVESSLKASTIWSGSKVSFVEQDSEVRVASVRNELIGDVRNVITGFLKNNRMELSKGSRDNIGGVLAGRSWIPLKNRETVLMMHEINVNCVNVPEPVRFGLSKFDHSMNKGSRFRKRSTFCRRICTNRIVGSRKGGTCTPLVFS